MSVRVSLLWLQRGRNSLVLLLENLLVCDLHPTLIFLHYRDRELHAITNYHSTSSAQCTFLVECSVGDDDGLVNGVSFVVRSISCLKISNWCGV